MEKDSLEKKFDKLQDRQLDPPADKQDLYKPNKKRRAIRRKVYERFYDLRDDPNRTEVEADWELADKEYNQYFTPDSNDWRAQLELPDAFSAIQAQAQETIERKSRPHLTGTEESDEPIEDFCNAILTYNMNTTGYDYQYHLAKLSAAIRGTAFLMDYWRTEKRVVKDPTSVEKGEIKYQDKEITDFDDDYMEWVPNEYIYIDEKAKHIDEAADGFRREILNIDEFHRIYGEKPGFFDTDWVKKGGDTSNRSFFRLPKDVTEQDVEILHYYNRSIDAYWVVANNVVVRDGPLPWKHKELPFAVLYQYRVPGRFYGIGIPKVIHYLSEERKAIRRLNLDRQKIIVAGAFLHNNAFDIDDEDTQLEPGKFISVDTNGQDVRQAVQQVQMGDVPASYFRTEEILLEDIKRAHGIDDRVQGLNVGGTATEAAILKESSLKRVNLVSIQAEMDTVVRIGRLKWSNIQFFYGTPRLEKIALDNQEREKKVYRQVSIQGKKFSIVKDGGNPSLRVEDVRGSSAVTIKPEMAKYLQGSFDVSVDADVYAPISKAIDQTKKTEMFSMMLSSPATLAAMDINGSSADVLKTNNIDPEKWLKNPYATKKDSQMLAEAENMIMAAGQPLGGTKEANEDHTLVHLMFTASEEFKMLAPPVQELFMVHVMEEHDANPAVGQAADLLGATGAGQPVNAPPGMNTPFAVASGGSPPQSQPADLEATNFAAPES